MALDVMMNLMEQLDTIHRSMIDLGQVKKKAIIANDVDRLIQLLNQETKLVKQIEQLEEQRIKASYQFLQDRGIKSQLNLNVTELSRLVFDPEDKQRLLHIQSRLSHTLDELKEINELNQKLLEQSLAFIDYSLDVLVDRPVQDAVYQHPGDKNMGKRSPGLFDTRA
ncbi:flagellar protein FlgN [Paenibacillus sp. JX-17]|uniref:Flagellar protein FlgN n=1 Tax=Paenibacillus lacisoli TaxID=3064525 RepID=A0ABT9CBC2_9BACL|nr:flagellar protein FlgN [Paenibacillus sp. JX-17]MDO7906561.1 flagellar protein FlgN [Paenibacillus sp. JX-17]